MNKYNLPVNAPKIYTKIYNHPVIISNSFKIIWAIDIDGFKWPPDTLEKKSNENKYANSVNFVSESICIKRLNTNVPTNSALTFYALLNCIGYYFSNLLSYQSGYLCLVYFGFIQ